MASSGSKTVAITKHNSLKFRWWENAQYVNENATVIGWALELITLSSGQIISSASKEWKVTIDGSVYSGTNSINVGNNTTLTLASGLSKIYHNSDGSKTFSYSFQQLMDITFASEYIGTVYGSSSGTLDSIPRKSTLTASNGTLGTEQTLTVSKAASAFTHTISYVCGSASGTICEKASGTSISWTPPNELASQAPSANSVSVTLTITTYNGSTSIGSSSVTISCGIPYTNTFVPVLLPSTSDAMGYSAKYGAFVQGQSKLKVDITTYGAYGAWITSVKTTFDGKTYTTDAITTDTINSTGTLELKITVTDSRGRTSTATSSVTVLPYEYPKITALSASRCNADGTLNPAGSYMLAKFSATVSALNSKNGATYYIGYKKVTDADHTAVELSNLSGKYSVTDGTYVIPADPAFSYTVILSVIDDFKQTRITTTGSSAKKVWSLLKKDGEIVGIAFGKIAEHENVFDIGMQVKFSGGGDCVVEQGEKDGWTYRKWDSGVAECWKIQEFSTTINTAFGSMYCGNAAARVSYPFAFTEKPVENVTLQSGSTQAILYCESSGYGVNGASASARYNVFRPGAVTTTQTFYLSFHVIGKWK